MKPKGPTITQAKAYTKAVLKQVAYPFEVYKRGPDGEIVYVPEGGVLAPVRAELPTWLARLISAAALVAGTLYANEKVLGVEVSRWIEVLFGGG